MSQAIAYSVANIDPNVRVRGNQTFVGYEHLEGVVELGKPILCWENETDSVADGVVTDIDVQRRVVYIDVAWKSFRRRPRSYCVIAPTADSGTADFSLEGV